MSRSFINIKGPSYCVDDPSSLKYWKTNKTDEASPILRKCHIVSLSDAKDPANGSLHHGELPEGAELVAIGTNLEDFDMEHLKSIQPNVLFVSHPLARGPLQDLLRELPSIEWVHTRSAGIDFVTSKGLSESNVYVTNAKGQFSSTLAEYTMMACSYFAKVRKKTRIRVVVHPFIFIFGWEGHHPSHDTHTSPEFVFTPLRNFPIAGPPSPLGSKDLQNMDQV
jgi:hypothetical protein